MEYPNLRVVDHSLALHKLTLMRDRTPSREADVGQFRRLMREIGLILCAEAMRDFARKPYMVETAAGATDAPQPFEGQVLAQDDIVVIPILRAGLGLAEAFYELVPTARSGHIGLYSGQKGRPEPINYLTSIPNSEHTDFFILDPMIASASTIIKAVEILLGLPNVEPSRIRVISIVAAQEGVVRFYSNPLHSAIRLFTLSIEPTIDQDGYTVPGIGSPGSRLFAGRMS